MIVFQRSLSLGTLELNNSIWQKGFERLDEFRAR